MSQSNLNSCSGFKWIRALLEYRFVAVWSIQMFKCMYLVPPQPCEIFYQHCETWFLTILKRKKSNKRRGKDDVSSTVKEVMGWTLIRKHEKLLCSIFGFLNFYLLICSVANCWSAGHCPFIGNWRWENSCYLHKLFDKGIILYVFNLYEVLGRLWACIRHFRL